MVRIVIGFVGCTNQSQPILMSSSILYHFEWFRHELERCVCDDDNDHRTQHVTYLLNIMEQRIRSASTNAVPATVVTVATEPRVDGEVAHSPMAPITARVHRIVGGKIQTTSRVVSASRSCPNIPQQTWHLSSSHPYGWSQKIIKTSRRRH